MDSAPAFLADGFVRLPRLVEPHELGRLAAAVDAILALDRPSCMQRPGNDLVPLRWNDAIVAIMLGNDRRLAAIEAAIGSPRLTWISGYVSTKTPESPALWWHQDWWCWDHPVSYRKAASQVALLCYPGATDEASGALRVLPGSHHRSLPLHTILPEAHSTDANALTSVHPAMSDCAGQVTLEMRPGDAVVLDYRLLHGTHPNARPTRRDCILLSFAPAWNALPDDIRAHLAMHPALPAGNERARSDACSYARVLPKLHDAPASLVVNRNAPASFAAN